MSIENFKKFQKEKLTQKDDVKEIWGYTRVSSKLQLVNNSLEEQRSEIVHFASRNGYTLKNILGGTYESASEISQEKSLQNCLKKLKAQSRNLLQLLSNLSAGSPEQEETLLLLYMN